MLVLSSEQMRAADSHAIDTLGIPSLALMECAGVEVVRALEEVMGELAGRRVLVLCGRGNNGGDGMVVARRLDAREAFVQVLLLADEDELSADAQAQWDILRAMTLPAETCDEQGWTDLARDLDGRSWDVVVDAMLGTGARGPLEGLLALVVADLNASDLPVVSVDVPTGLSGSSAEASGAVVEASLTVALAAPKLCHALAPAMLSCGALRVADIGIPESSLLAAVESGPVVEIVEVELVAELIEELADRPKTSHKGTWGHVVIVGGTASSPGAPALAARAALVAGAGLVSVAAPEPCTAPIAAQAAELMHLRLPADAQGATGEPGAILDEILERASLIVAGPGLGCGAGAAALVEALLERARVPLVLDADALNLVAASGRLPEGRGEQGLVLTPHPGELARLATGLGLGETPHTMDERLAVALALAERTGAVVVLKGFRTVVALADGSCLVNPTGGPGLATAGSGDVLAGFIGGLLAQGLEPAEAATAAVYLHGLAGDRLESELGQMSLTASGLLSAWPAAVASVLRLEELAGEG